MEANFESRLSALEELVDGLRRFNFVKCLTIREVASLCGCSTETIRNAVKSGKLRKRYPNVPRAYHLDDVEVFRRGWKAKKEKKRTAAL